MDNCSVNVCNLSHPSPIPYVAISVAHMLLVIVPTILMGATILYHVHADRKMRDPITILLCGVTITCMVAPSTYGLLLDMSMIADLPLLGSCSSPSRTARVGITIFFSVFTRAQMALITLTQFLVIKYGKKRISYKHVLAAFAVVTAISMVFPFIICMFASSIEAYGEAVPKFRGSWCVDNKAVRRFNTYQTAGATIFVIITETLTVGLSIRSYFFVKQSTMEIDHTARSVILVSTISVILEFAIKLPMAIMLLVALDLDSKVIVYSSICAIDTQYFSLIILFLTTHRGIRSAVFSKVINYIKNRNTVIPQIQ